MSNIQINPYNFPAGIVGGWKEVARTTLGSPADSITVSGIPNKQYYMILTNIIGSGSTWGDARLNGDTGTNYALRRSLNGAADTTLINYSYFLVPPNTFTSAYFMTTHISNLVNKEKLGIENCVDGSTVGAGTAPVRYNGVSKWVNTTDSISSFSRENGYTGDYAAGSEIVVLGYDPTDIHPETDNFWEELASVDYDASTPDELVTGTIAAKKYLWVQAYINGNGTQDNTSFRFNGDTGNNYCWRNSANGGADYTVVNYNYLRTLDGDKEHSLTNTFIVNNSASEKLLIANAVQFTTAGAGTAPNRNETVGKWANTSSQITDITYIQFGAGSFDTGSTLKVWGHD